jgi:gliding motility-associated protein GldC
MKKSRIVFNIDLDAQNVPEKIQWDADDKPEAGLEDAKAISVSIWDHKDKNTLRIDLWTKDMPVDEMKRFYIESLGGLAQSVLRATGDELMADQMNQLVDKLVLHVQKNP